MNNQIYNALAESRERGERLRRIRNLANLPRRILCDEAGININTYIGYEVGRYGGLTQKGANKIIQYLHSKGVYCSFEWLMHGVGKGPDVVTDMPLCKADEIASCAMTEQQKIEKELALFRAHYEHSVTFQIVDDGMLPAYEKGSYVAGIPLLDSSIARLIGFACIVQTKDGETLVRHLRQGRHENTYILTCTNPDTLVCDPVLYNVKLIFASKIIWHRKVG